jgi:hypothetical protein
MNVLLYIIQVMMDMKENKKNKVLHVCLFRSIWLHTRCFHSFYHKNNDSSYANLYWQIYRRDKYTHINIRTNQNHSTSYLKYRTRQNARRNIFCETRTERSVEV